MTPDPARRALNAALDVATARCAAEKTAIVLLLAGGVPLHDERVRSRFAALLRYRADVDGWLEVGRELDAVDGTPGVVAP